MEPLPSTAIWGKTIVQQSILLEHVLKTRFDNTAGVTDLQSVEGKKREG